MKKPGEHIRVNLGQSPFIFDIDGMMLVSPHSSFNNISSASSRESSVALALLRVLPLGVNLGRDLRLWRGAPHDYLAFLEQSLQDLERQLHIGDSFHDELLRFPVIRRYDELLKRLSAETKADCDKQQEKQYVRQQVEATRCVQVPAQFHRAI
jgi:hypothetical protein